MENGSSKDNTKKELVGKNILIIEDDALITRLMERTLSSDGAHVYVATDGVQGVELFERVRPDLVILDIMLPLKNGWQVFRRLQKIARTPILFVSALGDDESIVKGLNDGAIDYIVKPFSPKVFLARTRATIRQTHNRSRPKPLDRYDDGYLQVDLQKRRVRI